jgi:hypothetical protein
MFVHKVFLFFAVILPAPDSTLDSAQQLVFFHTQANSEQYAATGIIFQTF